MHWVIGIGVPFLMALINVPFFPAPINVFAAGFCTAIGVATIIIIIILTL